MDFVTLNKKLKTYVSEKGLLKNVSEEVLFELLTAWEGWQGTAKDFYREIGFTGRQLARLLGKSKKLKREGYFGNESFKELQLENDKQAVHTSIPGQYIEVQWGAGKIIRFPSVEQVLEFIKKV